MYTVIKSVSCLMNSSSQTSDFISRSLDKNVFVRKWRLQISLLITVDERIFLSGSGSELRQERT